MRRHSGSFRTVVLALTVAAAACTVLAFLRLRSARGQGGRESTPSATPAAVTRGSVEAGRAGGVWNTNEILAQEPLGPADAVKWIYLAQGATSTPNVVLVRSAIRNHVHRTHDETVYVIRGTGTFRLGTREVPVTPGSVMFIPAGTVHGGTLGDGAALSVFAPGFDPAHPDREFAP